MPAELNSDILGDDQRLKVLIYPSLGLWRVSALTPADFRWFPLISADFRHGFFSPHTWGSMPLAGGALPKSRKTNAFSIILRCQLLLPLPPCWEQFEKNAYFSNTCATKQPPEHLKANCSRRCHFFSFSNNVIKHTSFQQLSLSLHGVFGTMNCKL